MVRQNLTNEGKLCGIGILLGSQRVSNASETINVVMNRNPEQNAGVGFELLIDGR